MKQYILYIISSVFLFIVTSCNEQNVPSSDFGYLNIDGVNLSNENELVPLSRAVDTGLKLEIWQGEDCVRSYEPGATELSKRIVLPIGEYVLKAFTPDKEEAFDEEIGIPIYEVEHSFSIVSEDITTISVVVPQINIGISIEYAGAFKEAFSDYSVLVYSKSGREVTIIGESANICYFNIPADGILYYKLTATNADGEVMTSEERAITSEAQGNLSAGNYKVLIDIAQ
ncbi:DUF4493 domain-containing protein [Bacteroides sp.]